MSEARLRNVRRLRRARNRRRAGLAVVEGPAVVLEALASPVPVRWVLVGREYARGSRGRQVAAASERAGVEVELVADDVARSLCAAQAPQPALACVETPALATRDFSRGRYLCVQGVQIPGNAGTLIRSAWGFGLDGVALCAGTVDAWNDKVVRGSAGAVFHVPLLAAPPTLEGLHALCADPRGAPVGSVVPTLPPDWVLVVGHETRGVDAPAPARRVSVPLRDGVDSLNVAVAGSILMHELTSRGRATKD